ncbi:MAG: nitroreductase family protein [Promethearchaeota archaeon]
MEWEQIKPVLMPDMKNDVHMGLMKVNKEKCTKCGLCMQNCPFKAWEEGEDGFPKIKEKYECFSCFNCLVACSVGAVEIVSTYNATGGFWKTSPYPLPIKKPLEPKDENGNPTEWNEIEKQVFNRRSVRNYKDKPVPESLIQRVLEAGRFAPSAGNCQPWKFIVLTNQELIAEIEQNALNTIKMAYGIYTSKNEDIIKNLKGVVEGPPYLPGTFDPRLALGGMGMLVRDNGQVGAAFKAPVVILLLADTRAISGPELNIGICGQNMNLVANSLGIKALWNGFVGSGANVPQMREKLGIKQPWTVITSLCLGYPKFKQEGVVPREYRPVTWFKEGSNEPEIQK